LTELFAKKDSDRLTSSDLDLVTPTVIDLSPDYIAHSIKFRIKSWSLLSGSRYM